MSQTPKSNRESGLAAVCVFCGASSGGDPVYAVEARRLGALIAAQGYRLIFGGGDIGLMGEVARAVRDGGAPVRGILPDFLKHLEPPMSAREEVVITEDLQSRKRLMLDMADAFVVLPGGLGTLDEYFEVLTSAQLQVFGKPIVIVDVDGYFAPLLALLDRVVEKGFARPEIRTLQHVVADADAAIAALNRLLGRPPQA